MRFKFTALILLGLLEACAFQGPENNTAALEQKVTPITTATPVTMTASVTTVTSTSVPNVRIQFAKEGSVVELERVMKEGVTPSIYQVHPPITLAAKVPDTVQMSLETVGDLKALHSLNVEANVSLPSDENFKAKLIVKNINISSGRLNFELSGFREFLPDTDEKSLKILLDLYPKNEEKRAARIELGFRTPPSHAEIAPITVSEYVKNGAMKDLNILQTKLFRSDLGNIYLIHLLKLKNHSSDSIFIEFPQKALGRLVTDLTQYNPISSTCSFNNSPTMGQDQLSDLVYYLPLSKTFEKDANGTLKNSLDVGRLVVQLDSEEETILGIFAEGNRSSFRQKSSTRQVQVVEKCHWDCPDKAWPYCAPGACLNTPWKRNEEACWHCKEGNADACDLCHERDYEHYVFCSSGKQSWFQKPVYGTAKAGTETATYLEFDAEKSNPVLRYATSTKPEDPEERTVQNIQTKIPVE